MTVMCVACNLDFTVFYDWGNHRIRYDLVKQNYDIMRSIGYSENLVTVINQCLEETETRRLKLKDLKALLDQVQSEPDDPNNNNFEFRSSAELLFGTSLTQSEGVRSLTPQPPQPPQSQFSPVPEPVKYRKSLQKPAAFSLSVKNPPPPIPQVVRTTNFYMEPQQPQPAHQVFSPPQNQQALPVGPLGNQEQLYDPQECQGAMMMRKSVGALGNGFLV